MNGVITNKRCHYYRFQETIRPPLIWIKPIRRRHYNQCSKCHLRKLYRHLLCITNIPTLCPPYLPTLPPMEMLVPFGMDFKPAKSKSKIITDYESRFMYRLNVDHSLYIKD